MFAFSCRNKRISAFLLGAGGSKGIGRHILIKVLSRSANHKPAISGRIPDVLAHNEARQIKH